MGIRSPIIVVSNKDDVQKIKEYCQNTKNQGDFECIFEGIKLIDNKIYVCVTTYTAGLTCLMDEFPNFIFTNESMLTTGHSNMDYPNQIYDIDDIDIDDIDTEEDTDEDTDDDIVEEIYLSVGIENVEIKTTEDTFPRRRQLIPTWRDIPLSDISVLN